MNMNNKGLVIVHTGNGKGKTTAALGMALRAWGQGMRVLILQFIKGGWEYGELKAAEKLGPNLVIRQMGEGFVRGSSESMMEEHKQAAAEAMQAAGEELASGRWDMVVLDEINYAIGMDLISEEAALQLISHKPDLVHVVLTGRNARPKIIETADLVTEMKEVKHPYKAGIKAQKGVEF
ncbi:cob(I)alamin adenosyltransferase [Propionispora hippei DSM 15287]|uniref:Cob(I)alamin adenosyltransferase n=1 Tax=Propionispora hippei DSM 15287 TaxID=1123003 RepID=A0A1M6KZN5_9FIRM|nr:cob(I)alamin adenosyltransferase [Propionispora hippei DSM 15287]